MQNQPTRAPRAANDNNRPAEFDKLLADHLPVIRKLAFRLSKVGSADIMSDAYLAAMMRWRNFDPSRSSFYTWIKFLVRDVARNYRVRQQRTWAREVAFNSDGITDRATMPSQYDAALLSEVMAAATGRAGRAAVMAGLGYTGKEIGAEMGLHPIYAQSCASLGRKKLQQFADNDNARRAA
jgi:DNA-directed RNA polymerase specialized sigma24 family protein